MIFASGCSHLSVSDIKTQRDFYFGVAFIEVFLISRHSCNVMAAAKRKTQHLALTCYIGACV